MGAAEFICKGQSQHASTEQDFLDILSRRDGEDHLAHETGERLSIQGFKLVAQHHLAHFNSSLRFLYDKHFRLGSSFDSSSSTQRGVMR